MKRTIFLVLLAALAFAIPAAAQDFTSPKPQFISFSLGVPVGYSLYDETKNLNPAQPNTYDKNGAFAGGRNFGVSFAIIDSLTVGYDYLGLTSGHKNNNTAPQMSAHLLRIAYSFTDQFGAALSFGTGVIGQEQVAAGQDLATAGEGAAIGLGAYGDLFQKRSNSGISYGLRTRIDYLANTRAFGQGVLLFNIGVTFGI